MNAPLVIYQAYGIESVINQCFFSILSLLRHSDSSRSYMKILIYTDQLEAFKKFFGANEDLIYEDMPAEKVKAWRGEIDFVHRVKIEVLRHAAERFPGPYFYLDSDTYFTKSPEQLFAAIGEGTCLMHKEEGRLNEAQDPLNKKMGKFIRKNPLMPPDTSMWNAGVLGYPESFASHLNEVLELTDKMYKLYPKHVMEQLAFSFVLQSHATVLPAEAFIEHYWMDKKNFQAAIDTFLSQYGKASEALLHLHEFRPPNPFLPKRKWYNWWRSIRSN